MRIKLGLVFVGLLVIMAGCKATKSNVDSSTSSKEKAASSGPFTIEVEYGEQYCGGAQPTDEIVEHISRPKPFFNGTIYIAEEGPNQEVIDEKMVQLDKEAKVTLNLDSGSYFISLIPLTPEPIDSTLSPLEMDKIKCMNQWRRVVARSYTLGGQNPVYRVALLKECNPCEEPRP
jgi:hypothetical protein